MYRLFVLGLAVSAAAWGQFHDLAATDAGNAVLFITPLRETGTDQASYNKIFVIAENGPQLLFEPKSLDPPLGPDRPSALSVVGNGSIVSFDLDIPCYGGSS